MNDSLSGGQVQVTGTGHYLLRQQNSAALYSGDLLGHFDFVTPLFPNDWQLVAQETQHFTVLDGPNAGVTGDNTLTFFSQDLQSVPQEPPTALGAPWSTTGFAVPD